MEIKNTKINNNINLGLKLNRVFNIDIKSIKLSINGIEVGLVK